MEIDSLDIRKVDKDTELAEKLLDFVENFSWEEVKEISFYAKYLVNTP